jgi:hypothetical protein
MAHEPGSDFQFLRERIGEDWVAESNDDAKRAIVDLLRSDIPLSTAARDWIAWSVEKSFFPLSPPQKKKLYQAIRAGLAEMKIREIRKAEGCTRAKAIEKVAALLLKKNDPLELRLTERKKGKGDPAGALERRLKRAKRELNKNL